jgi:uncharacterized protein (TIGR02452 family)
MSVKRLSVDFSNMINKPISINEQSMNIKMLRVDCWEHTKQFCQTISPPPSSIREHYDTDFSIPETNTKSNIRIYDMDTIDCALLFDKPLVLNLSDDEYAGGWVNMGSGAQEESIFRRSNYFQTLTQNLYPIMDDECIYSPQVSVIKSSENTNWKLYDTPILLDFVACPAIKYPFLDDDDKLCQEDIDLLENKIKMIIQVAKKYNHNTIIFGAMGCGAWQNPPHHVAAIFRKVLAEYDGVVDNYIFAILKNYNNDDDDSENNFDAFNGVFHL